MVNSASEQIKGTVSVSQYSSFMIEGSHFEEAVTPNGIKYYRAWVCCTMEDGVIEAIKDIQEMAIKSIIETTESFAPIMNKVQQTAGDAINKSIFDEH